jgi:hypothetical protein
MYLSIILDPKNPFESVCTDGHDLNRYVSIDNIILCNVRVDTETGEMPSSK